MYPSPHLFSELEEKPWRSASSTATHTASILPSSQQSPQRCHRTIPPHSPAVGRGQIRYSRQSRDRNTSTGRCRKKLSSGLPDDGQASCTPGSTPSGLTYPVPLPSDPRRCLSSTAFYMAAVANAGKNHITIKTIFLRINVTFKGIILL